MDTNTALILAGLIALLAALYSAVGHGGASGYLAAMALLGLAPEAMRPTALTLNVLVAGLALTRFYRPATFAWPTFLWLALGSVPCAMLGGMLMLPAHWYRPIVGVVLLVAAWQLATRARTTWAQPAMGAAPATEAINGTNAMPGGVAVAGGAGIGLLAGLTGVGGGIFLSPLLVLARWAEARTAAALAAAFVLVNSLAGLTGHVAALHAMPGWIALWSPLALAGAYIGSTLGSRRLAVPTLMRALAVVLVLAGFKLLLL